MIIPYDNYINKNLNCEEDTTTKQKLEDNILIDKPAKYLFDTFFDLKNKLNKFYKNTNGHYEYAIKITTTQSFALTVI